MHVEFGAAQTWQGPPIAEAGREAYHPYTSEGKRETCLSNLEAIARAASLYAQDNSGRLPLVQVKSGAQGSTWITQVAPYVSDSKPWTCPLAAAPAKDGSSYALNPVLAGGPVSGADDPAATLLLGDAGAPGALALRPPYPGWNNAGNVETEAGLAFRHEGVAGVVYADGHAGTIGPGAVKEAALWGGSAAARASLERIAQRSARSQALVTALRAGNEAGTVRVLKAKDADVTATSRDLLALWELNAQKLPSGASSGEAAATASQSVDALGWKLAWAWHRLGQDAALQQLESRVGAQAAAELERVKSLGLQARAIPGGGSFDAPQGWTGEETAQGSYRTLNLRSRVPGLYLYVEIGTRSTLAASPSPIDWHEAERRLQAKYGVRYRRLSMGSGTFKRSFGGGLGV